MTGEDRRKAIRELAQRLERDITADEYHVAYAIGYLSALNDVDELIDRLAKHEAPVTAETTA